MKMINGKKLYIVEGIIEKLFLEQAKEKDLLPGGEVKTFNLMQEPLKKQSSLFHKKYSNCYCIIDTDCSDISNLEKLLANLQLIKRMFASCNIELWIQNRNFEEELMYILECRNINVLCKKLHISNESIKGLKDVIAKQGNCYGQYLTDINIQRYCIRPKAFLEILKSNGINLPNTINVKVQEKS